MNKKIYLIFLLLICISSYVYATPACDCNFGTCPVGSFCWVESYEGCQLSGFHGICSSCLDIRGADCMDSMQCGEEQGCGLVCIGSGPVGRCGYPAEFSSYGWIFLVVGLIAVSFFLVKKRLK